jgi:hypothetical protein
MNSEARCLALFLRLRLFASELWLEKRMVSRQDRRVAKDRKVKLAHCQLMYRFATFEKNRHHSNG